MKRIIRKYGPPIFTGINDFGQGSLAAPHNRFYR